MFVCWSLVASLTAHLSCEFLEREAHAFRGFSGGLDEQHAAAACEFGALVPSHLPLGRAVRLHAEQCTLPH